MVLHPVVIAAVDHNPSLVHRGINHGRIQNRTIMIPGRSAILGLAVGAAFYGGLIGFEHFLGSISKTDQNPDFIANVSPVLTPSAKAIPGARIGANFGVTTVSPVLTPGVIVPKSVPPTMAPVLTPRISLISTPVSSTTPSPTPSTTVTPRITTPTPTPSPTPMDVTSTPLPSVAPSITPTPSPSPIPTPTPTPAELPHIVINEVAWAGTKANSADEWLELYNAGNVTADLTDWSLCEGSTTIVQLINTIEPGAYYLIERGADDGSITDITADLAHAFGGSGLSNSGENISLRVGSCTDEIVVDEIGPGPWYAGLASPEYASMERISALLPGNDSTNWASNNGLITTGTDASGDPVVGAIRGTPKYKNSVLP